jgi:cobalt/nickel transport system permease protein
MGVFAPTQLPLAVIEGLLTVVIVNLLRQYSHEELRDLRAFPRGFTLEARS